MLQTVDTKLAADGSITAISDTAISVGKDGSSSSVTEHDTAKAATDLPLRVTTQYTTAKKSGTDLADLAGYSGRVEIDLTVENLTVRSRNLTYDVAGASRTTPALVGAPFSIAASTVLPGTKPSKIVTDTSNDATATDGVVSANGDGDAVVQWGRLLAPPTSGASTTLHLVANVDDFAAPSFDMAAQPGISTDLSSTGVVNAAFGSDTDSELALQRRTIDLISQVNEVLARAGSTITEVRSNLETTSATLGVRTAERLKESSSSLASTMKSLSGQLGSLKGDLGSTVSGTQSTVLQQLQETTGSLDALLGDTSATAPTPAIDGNGCAAEPRQATGGASVYGNLLRVSAQLAGYADASEACKQQVSAQLASSVGPSDPTAEKCAADDAKSSLTCALFASSTTITSALADLVTSGDALAASLNPQLAAAALKSYQTVSEDVGVIHDRLTALQDDSSASSGKTKQALQELSNSIDLAEQNIGRVRAEVGSVHTRADAARRLIGETGTFDNSMQAQNKDLADQICKLILRDDSTGLFPSATGLSQEQADKLRSYLTSTPCDDGDDNTQQQPLSPPFPYPAPMDARLKDQFSSWTAVIDATNLQDTDSGVGGAIATLQTSVDDVKAKLSEVRDALASGDGDVQGSIRDLQPVLEQLLDSDAAVKSGLQGVVDQQNQLGAEVKKKFADADAETSKKIDALIDQQVRDVSAQATTSNAAVIKAFDQSVAGLRSTSKDVTAGAKGTIDGQKGKLERENAALASAVDAQTKQSLAQIDASTTASTRDVEGASTLLTGDLNRVMLDLGDRKVNGSGILGAMATSAAKSDSADYQLALASQNAAGYANVRAEDVAGILLQQEQFRASLDAATALPAFRMDVPKGATSTTLYAFSIGAAR
ncbi:hypothetical protein DEI97_015255 [Curtobacterium sp. MCLR17_032]|uniref:hypothetical protein n=1 Tax=Curtobacterium sp. MCLR17_032 TaxID=2175650 RepID=UPI0011B489F9|nr:hypothetical protein [Curtobacterium sp. MCLR17_032]WIE61083.1 hypothetical protein DEI97_015255 [Curtobacterium sp. MCLR17_032]